MSKQLIYRLSAPVLIRKLKISVFNTKPSVYISPPGSSFHPISLSKRDLDIQQSVGRRLEPHPLGQTKPRDYVLIILILSSASTDPPQTFTARLIYTCLSNSDFLCHLILEPTSWYAHEVSNFATRIDDFKAPNLGVS